MNRTMAGLNAALVSSALLTSCMSSAVFDYVGDQPGRRAAQQLPVVIAMNDLTIPNMRTEVFAPNQVASQRFGDVRFDATEARLFELFSASGVSREVRMARDLSSEGVAGAGFVVQYVIQSYASSSSVDAGGMFAGILGTILTAGLTGGSLIFMATVRHEHNFQVEVRLYRVSDSALISQRAPRTGDRISQYDTSGAEVVYRNAHQLQIRSGHCQVCAPSGADAVRFHREEGAQMARVIYDATMPALAEAMRATARTAAPTVATPSMPGTGLTAPGAGLSAPSAGGEADSFDSRVRARLTERSRRVLLCTGTDVAVLVVDWNGTGPATVAIQGVSDDSVVQCVRAAVGPLEAPETAGRMLHAIEAPE